MSIISLRCYDGIKSLRKLAVSSDKNLCLTLSKWQHQDSTKLTPISESKQNEKTESPSAPQITKPQLTKLDKFLVHRYSSTKYASADDVPNELPVSQVNAAKDKGRAKFSIFLIFMTVVGCLFTINLAKYHKSHGKSTYTEDLNKQHAEYSKAHREQMKITEKN